MLRVECLSKTYGEGEHAVRAIGDVSFEIAQGELTCIVGPSGCGKTTLLRCISGLDRPTCGSAWINGRRIDGPPRELALIFQDYSRSLFPWLTVRGNVALPLRSARVPSEEVEERVHTALDGVGLSHVLNQYPWQLSGGMQQRVAIARALAYRPQVLLMDEPFAALDAQIRAELEDLTLRVRDEFGMTILFVTHDIDESVYLGDRVVVLTASPTTVVETIEVSLPHPRDQVETKELAEFTQLRSHVLRRIREVSKSSSRAGAQASVAHIRDGADLGLALDGRK